MNNTLAELAAFITTHDGINDKANLSRLVLTRFQLIKDRSVYYNDDFAIRFSSANTTSFSNTVLSLSSLRKYDHQPFIVCLVTPKKNYLFLANSTFLKKISHSSQALRANNIRGSFNGSDILREFEGIENADFNLERLFAIHETVGFEGNLERLVEATNNISPTGQKFDVTDEARDVILRAPDRAKAFIESEDSKTLKSELDALVSKYKNEILLATFIENVNVRGRVIEYLITGEDERLRQELIISLRENKKGLPGFKTANELGDYHRTFDRFVTETDIKTKTMVLSSNPKAYNIDKILKFLAKEESVFLFYFVGVDPTQIANTVLVSMFQSDLLDATITLRHWAGRNSRGVTQFEGKTIESLLRNPNDKIEPKSAKEFLHEIINL